MADLVDTDDFELAVSTSHLLHRAQQLAADRFTVLVGENNLTLRQFAVLAAISKQPGLSQAELVRVTGIDRSTLADMMRRMEKRGLVLRSAHDSDGRANAVRLSRSGVDALTNARQHARAADAAILDALPRSKRKGFLNALEKLSKISDKAAEKAEREAKKEARKLARAAARAKANAKGKRRRRKRKPKAQPAGATAPPVARRKPRRSA